MNRIATLMTCAALSCLASEAEARKWIDATGQHSVEATFIELRDGNALLKKSDGTSISVPVAKLSAADRKFIEKEVAVGVEVPRPRAKPAPRHEKSEMRVLGYYVTPSLRRDSTSQTTPKSGNNAFLVVVTSIPSKLLVPSEAKFRSLNRKMGPLGSRELVRDFDPKEYQLYLESSRRIGRTPLFISTWEQGDQSTFGSWVAKTSQALDPGSEDRVAPCWMLPKSSCRPPFKLQWRKYELENVPQIDPREIKE